MYDVVIYGHLSVDKIYTGFNLVESLGCIANTWKALSNLSADITIDVEPTEIGEAIVYVDPLASKRYSKATLSKRVHHAPTIKPCKISAVQYVNALVNTDFIKELDGIVMCDVCTGVPLDHALLEHIDILFVADSEIGNVVDLSKILDNTIVVVHSPQRSFDNKNNNFILPVENILSKVNVLGAGDIYMACYMYGYLQGKSGAECLEFAHTTTTKILGENK
jgi:hypothetical protein